MASEPKASEHIKGVLSARQLSLTFLIPETSSRVTLASLGIAFQAKVIRYIRLIRVRFTTELFFRTRIYRIDTDASLILILSDDASFVHYGLKAQRLSKI